MAMFSGNPGSTGERTGTARAGEPGLTILASDMRLVGEFETTGVVKVEGRVEGTVRAETQVLIVKGGVVVGDIFTREAVIAGSVQGNIFAEERVEVQAGSEINGDVTSPRLAISEGGELNGRLHMGDGPKLSKVASPPARDDAKSKPAELRRAGSGG